MRDKIVLKKNIIISEKILSICIPTYNRVDSLRKIIDGLIRCPDQRFEIVILDNDSQDGTLEYLQNINDDRVVCLKNMENIGGINNGLEALNEGSAKYLLFCLDKDYLQFQYLPQAIDCLVQNDVLAGGFFSLNSKEDYQVHIYANGLDALLNCKYRGKHPTGYFFKKEFFIQNQKIWNFLDIEKVGAFSLDFLFSEICLLGNVAKIDLPLCITESKESARNSKSYTYTKNNPNLFFLPLNRFNILFAHVLQISKMNISQKHKHSLIRKLYSETLINVTYTLKRIYSDEAICSHYYIKSIKIGSLAFVLNQVQLFLFFIRKVKVISFRTRLHISLSEEIYYLKNLIVKFSKKKIIRFFGLIKC